ncbi:MAG: 50S ribosomal protein L9 [Halobacteriovoraceae bacterium]|nr:50S ribosomal protein L9 [Halobacteriovoraceae bacterium]MCB9093956.1 50S ribosomal protein L9 [Halobacteriovoraceae bacterium]
MKVILNETVKDLGNVGEIHNVSAGYARNFLFPRNLATLADDSNTKALEDKKRALGRKIADEKNRAEDLKKKLEGVTVTVRKKVGGSGKLFGTVTTTEVSAELSKQDVDVEKRLIVIERPIKQLGQFEIQAKLFDDVVATFKVNVEMDAKQVAEEEKKLKSKKASKKEEKNSEEDVEVSNEETTEE